jgi:RNA polymerase-binding transcription factor DksA
MKTIVVSKNSVHDVSTLQLIENLLTKELKKVLRIVQKEMPDQDIERTGDPLDRVSAMLSQQNEAASIARSIEGVNTITETLRRLRSDPSSFGICKTCKTTIPIERLEILPTTLTCTACN